MDKRELTEAIKAKALELGFARVGVTTPDTIEGFAERIMERTGYEGMGDPHDPEAPLRRAARPSEKVPETKSIISLVRAIDSIDFPPELLKHIGRIYLGRCYLPPDETVEGQRVVLFEQYLETLGIHSLYDHTNMQFIDRAIAARAGLIEYGRNNFAYAGEHGSFIVMVSIPVDVELECEVHEPRRPCPPDCRKCIDACPTHAMDDEGRLNPMRCVLLNIMIPGEIKDTAVTDLIGERIHGCDACQEACPRNKRALEGPKVKDPYLEWLRDEFGLEKLLFCDETYYAQCVRPVMYNYIEDIDIFRQNAAIAMGNSGNTAYLPALERAAHEGSEQVQRFARHAIEQLTRE